MDNLSGQVIKSYQMLERIGAGGFGAVYRALQTVVDREVAIKIILPDFANRPEFIRRFETEAQLVARLEHPHIVPLYDYWREPNSAYLVMRYLRGGSLRDSIEEHGAWSPRQVAQMVSQIGAALAFAHQNGVIHRDLKSDNVLLDEAGNCYLGDFGIAKDLDQGQNLTKDNILGTPAYLSPEQIRGEAATPQTDVYALGILSFESLAGIKPFIDKTPATILYRHLNEPLPDVTSLRPDLPVELNHILQRATAKDKADRYTDVLAFARDFQQIIRDKAAGFPAQGPSVATLDIMSITQAENELFEPKNPYKGLRAFQQADAGDFFGRGELVQRLLDRLDEDAADADFLAVVGPSGSGKSSVIKAGVLPAVQSGALTDDEWYTLEMVPGTHPLEELEAALLAIAPMEMPGLLQQLRENERGLVRAIKRILPGEDTQVLLLIDQFEEIFTLVENEQERTHFLDMILAAVQDARSRIKIIVTIRADFYDRPLLYTHFGDLIRRRTELVLPLSAEELEETITRPAERVGVTLEPGLVAAIVKDVNQQPGALPLLQYALTELFERRDGRTLTLKAYQDIGGTSGALARRAEEVYQSFDGQEQQTARQMFLRLVTLGDGTEDTRRRVLQGELLSIGNRDMMRRVIDTYGKYRLLTFDHDPQTRSSTIEVAHEALIRQWERMRTWLDESREGLRLQRRLTTTAQDWRQSGQDRSFLARGARLQQFEDWSKNSDIALNELESEYLEASIQAREEQLAAERIRQEREEALERQSRDRLRALAAVMAIAALVAALLALFAVNQSQEAVIAREEALRSADIAATNETDALLAREEAVNSAAIAATNEAVAVVAREEAVRSADEARSLALAANARNAQTENDPQLALALALAAKEAYQPAPVEVLRVLAGVTYSPGPKYLFPHDSAVVAAKFSADGQYAVSADLGNNVHLWRLDTGEEVINFTADSQITEVAISPDNETIATSHADGSIRFWNGVTGDEVQRLNGHTDMVTSLVYSPDGQQLVSGSVDKTVRLWDTATGTEIRRYEGHTGAVLIVDISSDGQTIISSAGDERIVNDALDVADRTVRAWDTETGALKFIINPQSGLPRAIDYSPDGSLIAVGIWDGSSGGTLRLYDSETGNEQNRIRAHSNIITDVVFGPDSRTIASAAWDKNIRVFDVQESIEIISFTGVGDRVLTLDYSPDGAFLLTGLGDVGNNPFATNDNSVRPRGWLWDLRTRDAVATYNDHTDWVWTVDVSNDGRLAASAGGPLGLPILEQGQEYPQIDNMVRIWDVETQETLQRLRAHTNTVDSVQFHPDNQRLLSSGWDGLIILWDITTGERLRLYREHRGRVYDVVFNRDGSRFLSAGEDRNADDNRDDNIIYLWDTETGEILQTFRGHTGGVNSVAFHPNETIIASASSDGTIRLWDVATGNQLWQFNGHTASVNEVIFMPNGRAVISSSWDDSVRMWSTENGAQIREFLGHNGNTFGLAISQDGKVLLTTSEDESVRMWDIETGQELHRFSSHNDWVQEVVLLPNEEVALSAAQDGTVVLNRILRTADEIADFAQATRYIRDLTCAERDIYRLEACVMPG